MILGKQGLLEEYNKGHITIEPFHKELVNPNSYDIRIADVYYEMDNANHKFIDIVPGTGSIDKLFTLKKAQPVPELGYECVILRPRGFILATTMEVVGSAHYTTLLKTKSTIARLGIDVCAPAGFGDIGYINKWTLEIYNYTNRTIRIPVCTRVAQIAFIGVDRPGELYSGNYLQQTEWKPESMLPIIKPHIMIKDKEEDGGQENI